MSANLSSSAAPTQPVPSRWGPFSHVAFTVIWTASVISNVGTAMFDTASGWLITSLDANPIIVSLVQVAVSLPLFLFTLPAGAWPTDSRRLLIAVELAILAVSVIFAGLVSLDLATPALLLATTFLLGVGGALTSPAWGSTIPLLVPKQDLDSATALIGVGFNIGRAAGPALGGLVIALTVNLFVLVLPHIRNGFIRSARPAPFAGSIISSSRQRAPHQQKSLEGGRASRHRAIWNSIADRRRRTIGVWRPRKSRGDVRLMCEIEAERWERRDARKRAEAEAIRLREAAYFRRL